jgi:CBS domain-containing protein
MSTTTQQLPQQQGQQGPKQSQQEPQQKQQGQQVPKQSQEPQQKQQQSNTSIENAASFIRKRIEEVKPAQFILRSSEIHSQKDLEEVIGNEATMNQLTDKLSNLDIKIQKIKDTSDPKQEAFKFVLSEEGQERFEVPEEEEAEEVTARTQATTQILQTTEKPGRGRASSTGSGSQRAVNNRGIPLPEPIRNIDSSQIQNFTDVLKNVSVQRIVYDNWTRKSLVLVNSNQTVDRALSRINTHNIHSIPVVDANSNSGAVIGILDILDIILVLSETWDNNSTRAQRREKLTLPISDLMSRDTHPPTFIMSIHTSLFDAFKQFAQTKISRVMVVERQLENAVVQQDKPEDMVIGLLTESDLIRFASENLMWIQKEKAFQQTLRQLNLGQRKPIIIQPNILAYQAFQEIHKNEGREGVALVDNTGKLVANVSVSNIKGLTRANMQLLFRPLTDFLSRDRKRGWWQLPICATLDTTLEYLLLLFTATKVHRIYIIDDDGKPIGEVSLSDVIQKIASL